MSDRAAGSRVVCPDPEGQTRGLEGREVKRGARIVEQVSVTRSRPITPRAPRGPPRRGPKRPLRPSQHRCPYLPECPETAYDDQEEIRVIPTDLGTGSESHPPGGPVDRPPTSPPPLGTLLGFPDGEPPSREMSVGIPTSVPSGPGPSRTRHRPVTPDPFSRSPRRRHRECAPLPKRQGTPGTNQETVGALGSQ